MTNGHRKTDETGWKRMRFKSNKVWMAIDKNRQPIVNAKKVRIKYQLDQDYEYWVHEKGVTPVDSRLDGLKTGRKSGTPRHKTSSNRSQLYDTIPKNRICIYTDGASSGNPGPAGIGVYLQHGIHEKKISRSIGIATNNVAELEAIRTGLLAVKNMRLPVRVFTDSRYAIGMLSLGWKARNNRALIRDIRAIMNRFADLKFVKVRGHSGHKGNEIADQLAASSTRKSR